MTAVAVSTFGSTNPTPATAAPPTTTNEIKSTLSVHTYSTIFPCINIYQSIQTSLIQHQNQQNQNFNDLLQNELFFKNPISLKLMNQQLLNQLSQHPIISVGEKQTRLSHEVLQDIYTLCKELHISIEDSIALYYESSLDDTRTYLTNEGIISSSQDTKIIARELYFYERSCLFKSILLVMKHRIGIIEEENLHEKKELMVCSDNLWIKKGLVSSLIKTMQELSEMAGKLKSEWNLQQPSHHQQQQQSSVEYLFHDMILEQRQLASECLFYLFYHTQGTGNEIGALLDITRDLSNQLVSVDTSKQDNWSEKCRKEGYSSLLSCVNTLIVSCLVSLDTTHELWDRNTHDKNTFGVGNALLPPPDCNISQSDELDIVHSKLTDGEASNGWSKKEIWGWFSSAYALLVFPHYSTNSDRSMLSDVSFRQCLSSALTTRVFWYARCAILSSLVPSQPLFPFITTVLSEFTSHYLNVVSTCGDFPISQAQWRRDKIEEMELRRVQEEQNRQLMGFLSGNIRNTLNYENLYNIDCSTRPDCLEDIMSLVIHLCHVYPSCSAHMWQIPDGENVMYPPIVSQLQVMSQEDNSVLSWYFHFLSILTFHSTQAATNVFLLWTSTDSNNSWNIKRCIRAIQWYITKLTPVDSVASTTPIPQSNTSSSSYYYGTDPSSNLNNSNAPAQNSTKELLQPDGIFFLSSILELLTNLLLRCPDMQPYISRSRDDELSCLLLTLFKLLGVVPNKHDVFRTISALVQHDRKACLEAWVFLEESQVLPTWMLSQYPIVTYPNSPLPLRKKRDTILYELDQPDGSYLCNEEFLGLLYTLITYGGCPSSLGGDRRRSGISPYIEYITTFLLPKVISSAMNYASTANKYRLISKLLDVLLAILKRFILPTKESLSPIEPVTKDTLQQIQFAFYQLLRDDNIGLTSTLYTAQFTNDDLDEMTAILQDFKEDTISVPITPLENISILNLPRPKTPAFCVLSSLLACHDYQLLYSMLYLLTEHSSNSSSFFHQQSYDHLSVALLLLAKDYPRDYDITSSTPRIFTRENTGSMILSKFSSIYSIPQLQHVPSHEKQQQYEFVPYFDLVSWKERTISNILSILTHVVIREQTFVSLLQSTGVSSTINPVLRFREDNRSVLSTSGTPGALDVHQVCITSRSSQLWMDASGAKHIFHHSSNPILSLMEHMSYTSLVPSSKYESTITTLSLHLFSYLCSTVPLNEISSMMYPREFLIPRAFGRHLSLFEVDATKRSLIMKFLLSSPSLSAAFLTSPNNACVKALIEILDKHDFLSLEDDFMLLFFHQCYELLYKLTASSFNNIISNTLRNCDFWYRQVQFYGRQLIKKSQLLLPSECYHTLAWLFKGFANELFWCKVNSTNHDHELHQHHRLLSLLLLPDADDNVSILQALLTILPLSSSIAPISSPPSFLPSESISESTTPLSSYIGEGEAFFSLYKLVDITVLLYRYSPMNNSEKELIQSWSSDWNRAVSLFCASTHVCHALEMIQAVLSLTWSESRVDLITDLIEKTLIRMLKDVSISGVTTYSYMSFVPLSTSIVLLVDILVSATASSQDTMQLEDVLLCACLLAKVIASCSAISTDVNHSECYDLCINRLSSSLSSLLTIALTLTKKQVKSEEYFLSCYMSDVYSRLGPIIGNYKTDIDFIYSAFLNVASTLSLLVFSQRQTSSDNNIMSVRVCLRSIIKFFNELESSSTPLQKTFLYRLFNNDSHAKSRLAKFLTLITEYDPDICTTLYQQIAVCKYGSRLLFQAGASTALAEAARKATLHHPKEFYMTETYGAVQLDPPDFFESHLLLLTTMLSSSDLSQDNRRRLMKDAIQFLTWSFPIGDNLLRSFPQNIGITRPYLFLFSLVAPIICCDTPQSKKDDELSNLEKRVIDFAYHIAAYPLPISALPRLPKELLTLEQQQQQKLFQFGQINAPANHCWWDSLTVSDKEQLSLPYPFASLPPTSYFGGYNINHSFATNTNNASNPWTQEKYFYAIAAMKSLESVLLFLKQRVTSSSSSGMRLDGISIAKGLCRCVELCRNIQRYSDSAAVNKISAKSTEPWKRIEYDSLISLASILKRCSNILLVIIDTYLRSQMLESKTMLIKADIMPAYVNEMNKTDYVKTSLDDFAKPTSLVLTHLKIEINGIDNNSNKEDMDRLSTMIHGIKNQISQSEN